MDRSSNVSDAANYIDAIKTQFQDRPDVYNQFLDIMKDFKRHTICTPGLIHRLCSLFRDHPSLIEDFNIFLPVGYRVDCGTNSQETNMITVTTPTGTTTQSAASYADGPITFTPTGTQSDEAGCPRRTLPAARRPAPAPSGSMQLGPSTSTIQMFTNSASDHPHVPPEWETAIHYVSRIKVLFADDPHTYMMFLEALSTGLDENELLSKVQTIFKDKPDVFEDFRAFLTSSTVASMDEDL